MKDKKRVQTILLILIGVIAIILAIVLIFGGLKDKQVKKYYNKVENAACKLAEDENYNEVLCDAFKNLCKIDFEKLINREYIDSNLINPINKKKISEDTKSYVQVSWKDEKMVCTYKEG